jgi:hypothetical protein
MEKNMNSFNTVPAIVALAIILSCGVGIASAQSDSQLLANLKANEAPYLPVSDNNFEIFGVVTMCPSGCDVVDNIHGEKALIYRATTQLSGSQLTPQLLESFFLPILRNNYCGSDQASRGIWNAATVKDSLGINHDVYMKPSDCPATGPTGPILGQMKSPNADFLNKAVIERRATLPITLGAFRLTEVASACPYGCEIDSNKDVFSDTDYVLMTFKTPGFTKYTTTMAQVAAALKPSMIEEYCGSDAQKDTNIVMMVIVDDMNNQRIGSIRVGASDCPAMAAQKPKVAPKTGPPAITNLAFLKAATQSSNIGSGYPAMTGLAPKAVDGQTDGAWNAGSVTHTADNGSVNPWWQVDLGADYNVNKIQIWNRTDCCRERLTNYRIWTSTATGGWEEFAPGLKTYRMGESYPLTFTGSKRARYVRIQIRGEGAILSLAEVKVFGAN